MIQIHFAGRTAFRGSIVPDARRQLEMLRTIGAKEKSIVYPGWGRIQNSGKD
jgi:hypothetical protein